MESVTAEAFVPELCSGSSFILLDSNDFENLPRWRRFGRSENVLFVLEKDIDVRIESSTVVLGEGLSGKWQSSLKLKGGSSNLCGSCEFCSLVLASSQSTLDTEFLDFKGVDYSDGLQHISAWGMGGSMHMTEAVHLLVISGNLKRHWNGQKESIESPFSIGFELFAEEGDRVAKLLNIHRLPLDTSTLSETNIKKISTWISECVDTCCEYNTRSAIEKKQCWLPTRLIDVGRLDITQQPRLIDSKLLCADSSKTHTCTKYLALSYCWGSTQDSTAFLTTTFATIGTRMEGIKLQTMPQTFKDIITVAKVLAVQYVWIDSLCIVQDDPKDWQIESSMMADIFSNAYVTVVAAAAASPRDSFLQRDAEYRQCRVPYRSGDSGLVEGYFGLRHRRQWHQTDRMSQLDGKRWITRGWTFQEEHLAQRLLAFGVDKIFMICGQLERFEDTAMVRFRPPWERSLSHIERGKKLVEENRRKQGNIHRATPFDFWLDYCKRYSQRELTYAEDKLPAISGIASRFKKQLQCQYLAGVWRSHLMHDLFWNTVGSASKPKEYRAPSWSWASLDARITWPNWQFCTFDDCKTYCTILDATTVMSGLDPFGAVQGGHLKISGAIIETELLWGNNIESFKSQYPFSVCHNGKRIAIADLDMEKGESKISGRKSYWSLLVAKCSEKQGKKPIARGLVLQKLVSERDGLGEFARVGIFKIFPEGLAKEEEDDSIGAWKKTKKVNI
ncbi:hypothetical protein LSUE1_G004910, partial [Lachnellula suecica]